MLPTYVEKGNVKQEQSEIRKQCMRKKYDCLIETRQVSKITNKVH